MIFNKILLFRQFFGTNSFCKTIKLKCFSTLPKNDSKKTKEIKEIKDFVINQNKFEGNSSDLKKPVLLYANENCTFYQRLFILNVCQGFFWIYLANVGIAYTLKKHKTDDKLESDEGFLKRIVQDTKLLWNQHSNQMFLSIALLICGQLSISLFTLFTIRSVRYIILSPGARNVRITTFSVTGSPNRYRNYNTPLENVSAFQYRNSGGSYVPLKVKGKWFYFLVDSNGQFFKPSLFDQTVGTFRVFK